MRNNISRRGFTLVEIIFVIFVLGILLSVAISHFNDTDSLIEDIDDIYSKLRYTEHLALVNQVCRPDDQFWYKKRWTIKFKQYHDGIYYTIYRDLNNNNQIDDNEIVVLNGEKLTYPNTYKTTIYDVSASGGCQSPVLSFDYLGRPYSKTNPNNPADGLLTQDCKLTFHTSDGVETINIIKTTGYIK